VKTYAFGPFRLDLESGELRKEAEEITLEPRVFALLAYLTENAGRVIPREELLEKLWPDTHVTDASLSQAVASLRDALDDDVREPLYLVTLPRRGYKFVAKVSEQRAATAGAHHILYGLQDFILAPGDNVIGRSGDAAVRIRSDDVSRHHARVVISSDHARIEDLGSRNGTIVNGQRIQQPRELNDGDEIVIGGAKLVFQISRATRSTATVPKKRPS
jgi:DNA-binding winged helix-turn-helix (wHTH) protein